MPTVPAFPCDNKRVNMSDTLLHTQEVGSSNLSAPTKPQQKTLDLFAVDQTASGPQGPENDHSGAIFAQPLPTNAVQIPLTQGYRAIVDRDDYPRLSLFKWRLRRDPDGRLYAIRGNDGQVYMHRVIMDAKPGEFIDHWNGNGLDNRRANLRRCTNAENVRNSRTHIDKKTAKLKGVYFNRQTGKYRAQIMHMRRKINLGNFTDEVEAGKAYDAAARKLQGEFARVNFPE